MVLFLLLNEDTKGHTSIARRVKKARKEKKDEKNKSIYYLQPYFYKDGDNFVHSDFTNFEPIEEMFLKTMLDPFIDQDYSRMCFAIKKQQMLLGDDSNYLREIFAKDGQTKEGKKNKGSAKGDK